MRCCRNLSGPLAQEWRKNLERKKEASKDILDYSFGNIFDFTPRVLLRSDGAKL